MEKFNLLKHTLKDTGKLVPVSEVQKIIQQGQNDDWYYSLYTFPQEAVDYFVKNNNSIAGYTGNATCSHLFFDLDSKEDINIAKSDAQELIVRLQKAGLDVEKFVRVYFSGKKGFHIEVPLSKEFTPLELKTICTNIAGDLKSFDPVVYNPIRTLRILNTRHQISGLFKIELQLQELFELTIDQIIFKAQNMSEIQVIEPVTNLTFLEKFAVTPVPIKPKAIIVDSSDVNGIRGLDEIDYTQCPKSKPRCVFALEHGVMIPGIGERSELYLRLASYYRNQGFAKEVTYNALKGISRLNARLYPEHKPFSKDELWLTAVSSAYGKQWKQIPGAFGSDPNNDVVKKYCDAVGKFTSKPCCVHNQIQEKNSIVQISDVSEDFNKFASNFDKNSVKTGIDFIDRDMKITVGTTTLLIGAAGSGKTTMALNILENANINKQASVFFSMDMHKNLIYLKLAMKHTSYTKEQIFKFHKENNKAKIQEIKDVVSQTYKLTHFDFSSTLTLENMRDKIFDIEQRTGEKIKFCLVDYAGRISGPHSDSYANSNYNALKSVEIANVTDTAMVILSQISRQTGDGSSPIRTKRAAKDSGTWEESATNVITLWRPFMGDADRDDVMRLFLAKNRMGAELEQVLHWDGSKSLVRDMTANELLDYNANRGDKAEREYLKSKTGKIIDV